MTVREFVQTILLEAPSLDAEICFGVDLDDLLYQAYTIKSIDSWGEKDSLHIQLEKYEG